ncbi:uncharacterized protein LOC125525714 [Triticum urartu]|uniref:Peptidase M48 domain-containing protein n=1 Tax=Triticum urartu TaxID=4572 RepID=A0A8R7V2U2_TRIUA|nr:uncharacterized protein LOC125525714 [Triticum urartu]
MSCRGISPSVLLPPFLYKTTAFRLLQPQPEQSSVVLDRTRGLLFQHSCRPPVLPQAMLLPRHYYTAPWHGPIQGRLFHNIIKHINRPPALAQATLLSRPYRTVPWHGEVLASTHRRLFSRILPHNSRSPALARGALLPRCFYTTTRQFKDMESIRRLLFRGITPGIFLPRWYFSAPLQQQQILGPIRGLFFGHIRQVVCRPWQYCVAPSRSAIHFARSYFGCLWKVTVAAAFINIMWSFVYHTYLVRVPYTSQTRFLRFETVPYTNRIHFVVRSPLDDREYGESCFSMFKRNYPSTFFSPLHPDSVRVNLITAKLVRAVQRGLDIKGYAAALVHGSPCKDASLDGRHAVESNKQGKSCRSQPQITHLDGLDLEVFVMKNDQHMGAVSWSNGKILVFTGLLNNLETHAEIATILAHEIAHLVARHWSELIIYKKWFPYPLKVYFVRRIEREADRMGMLIMAAAGFDPHIAPKTVEKLAGNDIYHLSGKKRAQLLSKANIMDEALELYREVMLAKAP